MKLYKTEQGQAAFKQRSPLFSARQRSAFILFDGRKTVGEVLTATAGLGLGQADVDYLLGMGFLSPQPVQLPPDTGAAPLDGLPRPAELTPAEPVPPQIAPSAPPAEPPTEQQRYFDAKPIATQLTASLGLRGFMLNLAVEGAAGYPELLKLLPKIQDAVGAKACRKLERVLYGLPVP
jgi:hypothetical protein